MRRFRSCAIAALVSAVGIATTVACAFAGPPAPAPESWQMHAFDSPLITECSGLVQSRTRPNTYWTHNDSGDLPRIFAVDDRGQLLASFDVAGAEHHDWEDIAIDDSGRLYLADVGNNFSERTDLRVYRIAEPDPTGEARQVRVERSWTFRYADQEKLGDRTRMNFDSEAVVWRAGSLFLFTKHRSDTFTKLYRLDLEGFGEQSLEPIARFDLDGHIATILGNTTGADLHAQSGRLALLTYTGIHFFDWPEDAAIPKGPTAHLHLETRVTQQAEAVSWSGTDVLVANEQGRLFRIPVPHGGEAEAVTRRASGQHAQPPEERTATPER